MPFSCGIVGLPNSGKSTLFSALTKHSVDISPYPFCTISPNHGIVEVKDERLDKLHKIFPLPKKTYTTIEFVDIAGLIKNAHKGEGLGNQFLSHIREVDIIVHVVRNFEDDKIAHPDGNINPKRDIDVINLELIFKDIETIEKSIEKNKNIAKSGNEKAKREIIVLQKVRDELNKGIEARNIDIDEKDMEIVKNLHLLTSKKVVYVINTSEGIVKEDDELNAYIKQKNSEAIYLCAKLELEVQELSEEEKKNYLKESGYDESGLDKLIRTCYRMLDLITFFTVVGEKEVRAWGIKKGTKAKDAAGKIHQDIKEGFIKAEVINYNDLIKIGDIHLAKEKGLLKTEGKDYIVQDGDIINFRFR